MSNATEFTVSYVSQKGEPVFCLVSGHDALNHAKEDARIFCGAGCTEVRITAGDKRGMEWLRGGGILHMADWKEGAGVARCYYRGTGR